MTVPSQSDLLADIEQLKTYEAIYRNGNVSEEAMLVASLRAGGATSGGSVSITTSVTEAEVSIALTSTTALAANTQRKDAIFINNSPNDVYLSRGNSAIANRGILLKANGGFYEITSQNLYKGQLNAVSTGAAANIMVSEGT